MASNTLDNRWADQDDSDDETKGSANKPRSNSFFDTFDDSSVGKGAGTSPAPNYHSERSSSSSSPSHHNGGQQGSVRHDRRDDRRRDNDRNNRPSNRDRDRSDNYERDRQDGYDRRREPRQLKQVRSSLPAGQRVPSLVYRRAKRMRHELIDSQMFWGGGRDSDRFAALI